MIFKGLGVALVTPFINNEVNYEMLKDLIEMQIAANVDSIIILGTTGENVTLSLDEKHKVIDFSIDCINGRVPVIIGTGGPNTLEVIEISNYAKTKGANGLLIVTPYYNKPTQAGLYQHYLEITKNVDLPIILYNVPSRTGVNLNSETVIELAKIENIVGIKEASGDLLQIIKIINDTDKNFYVYSGNDDQTLDILKLGGMGVISVTANLVPRMFKTIIDLYFSNELEKAEKEFSLLRNLNQILFIEPNPVPIKAALNLIGIDVGGVRLPLVELSNKNKNVLKLCLDELGLEMKT
ncbi:MAG: 4-hydroxy-tetrahydrodipicolinate synthase [Bacilli bacterium]|nr:4-hydroxy-tetrahydrodipicolinate synthase [Bacilli bacterium]